MTFSIEISPEEKSRLDEVARRQGITPEVCVRQLLRQHLPGLNIATSSDTEPAQSDFFNTATEAEWEAAMDNLALGGENLPVLPPEAFDRENLYEDRG